MQFDLQKDSCIYFTMLFLYRRLAFALIITFDDYYTVFQLAPFILIGLGQLAYILYWQPLETLLFNALTIFNETILVVIGYQMYLFTDYVTEPEMRFKLGNVLLGFVYFDIAINLVVLVVESSGRTMRWVKGYYILKKHRK